MSESRSLIRPSRNRSIDRTTACVPAGQLPRVNISGRKSKRKAFFDFTRGSLRWRFFEPYEPVLQDYEDAYRTPEFYKASILRAELLGIKAIDPNQL